jgi:hypothetical protein
VDDPSLMSISDSIKSALGSRALALHGDGANAVGKSIRPLVADHGLR